MRSYVLAGNSAAVDIICKKLGNSSGNRITLILPDGKVIGDTEENPSRMVNHADRVEIRSALRGEVGSSIRFSTTLQRDMMYVAIPMHEEDKLIAVVRTSVSLVSIDKALTSIYMSGILIGLVIAGVVPV